MNKIVAVSAATAVPVASPSIAAAAPQPDPKFQPTRFCRDAVRPELRDAVDKLSDAYYVLRSSHETYITAFNLMTDWVEKNPQPRAPRAYRKWSRRHDRYSEQTGIDQLGDALRAARQVYRKAQDDVGLIRAGDFNELAMKAAASMAFEGGILDDGKDRRHIHLELQKVSFSLSMDVLLLAGKATGLPEGFHNEVGPDDRLWFNRDEVDPAFALIRAKREADVLHSWAIEAQDEAEKRYGVRSEEAEDASERCEVACHAVNEVDWKLATTPPTTLAGIAAVLRLANLIEDAGMEWPLTDTIGPDGWHYQLRETMAKAIERIALTA